MPDRLADGSPSFVCALFRLRAIRSRASTGINETLSAITNAMPSVKENGEKVTRAFERVCFQRVASAGFGRSRQVYEMVWADGSKRTIYGL